MFHRSLRVLQPALERHHAIHRKSVVADRDIAEWGCGARRLRPKYHGDAAHQEEAEAPSGEQGVDHPTVEPPDNYALYDDTEHANGEPGEDESEPEIDPGVG